MSKSKLFSNTYSSGKGRRGVMILFLSLMISVILGSCEEGPGDLVVSEGEMEDVLYDYHIADGICLTCGYDSVKRIECINAVFTKHGINREIFDSSMVYYLRHANIMQNIYKNLGSRIENEARLEGIDGNNIAGMSTNAASDTANIWNLEKTKVFSPEAPYNTMRFDFKADSTFKAGDRFMLSFNSDFIYQEGMRNGYAVFVVILKNDSVVTRTTSITSTSQRTLEINDYERIGIKELKGYFMLRPSNIATERNSSTVKMMILTNILLVKMHTPDPAKQDSINNNNEKRDSSGFVPRTVPIPPHSRESGMH